MQLTDKLIVITGGATGLGQALAKESLRHGARVIILDCDQKKLVTTAHQLGVTAMTCDITDERKVKAVFAHIQKTHGPIEILINNAGIWLPHGLFEKIDSKQLKHVFDVNLFGTLYCTQAILPTMKRRRKGMIINIISVSALAGRPRSAGYCASKYAQDGLTQSLQLEVAEHGITTIAVYPGRMKTSLWNRQKPDDMSRYLDPTIVARRIIANLRTPRPRLSQIIR